MPPSCSKSHTCASRKLTLAPCRHGCGARFFTAADIVNTYREARESKTILRLEASLRRMDLIVIDELGYLPIDRVGAESLFGFFSRCYEQTSVIVTTNLPFGQWPSTFAGEERMTGALLDRFTHRLEVLTINDIEESYRVKQARKNNKKKLIHRELASIQNLISSGLFFDCHFHVARRPTQLALGDLCVRDANASNSNSVCDAVSTVPRLRAVSTATSIQSNPSSHVRNAAIPQACDPSKSHGFCRLSRGCDV